MVIIMATLINTAMICKNDVPVNNYVATYKSTSSGDYRTLQ